MTLERAPKLLVNVLPAQRADRPGTIDGLPVHCSRNHCLQPRSAESWGEREQKITLDGNPTFTICWIDCADYECSHSLELEAATIDRWPAAVRVCKRCRNRGAEGAAGL